MSTALADAFDAACEEPPNYQPLIDLIEARTGQLVTEEWVESSLEMLMGLVWFYAPCKRDEWTTVCSVPSEIVGALAALLCRWTVNPSGIRTLQAGEYSQTWANEGVTGGFTTIEQQIISQAAGCGSGGLISVRGTVDKPIPGYGNLNERLEEAQEQPRDVRLP